MVRLVEFVKRRQLDSAKTFCHGLCSSLGKSLRRALAHMAVDVGIETKPLTQRATKEAMHRHTQFLPQKVPQCLFNATESSLGSAPTLEPRHHLHSSLNLPGIMAVQLLVIVRQRRHSHGI